MGWVEDGFECRTQDREERTESPAETRLQSREQRKWIELMRGLEQDVKEFERFAGDSVFRQLSNVRCRISNPASGIAVVLTADLCADTIHYIYQPEQKNIAVPEGAVLSLRTSDASVELYSADQRLTSQQARQLILEPLLFPPTKLEKTGT